MQCEWADSSGCTKDAAVFLGQDNVGALYGIFSSPSILMCILDARFRITVPEVATLRVALEVSEEHESLGIGFYVWALEGTPS